MADDETQEPEQPTRPDDLNVDRTTDLQGGPDVDSAHAIGDILDDRDWAINAEDTTELEYKMIAANEAAAAEADAVLAAEEAESQRSRDSEKRKLQAMKRIAAGVAFLIGLYSCSQLVGDGDGDADTLGEFDAGSESGSENVGSPAPSVSVKPTTPESEASKPISATAEEDPETGGTKLEIETQGDGQGVAGKAEVDLVEYRISVTVGPLQLQVRCFDDGDMLQASPTLTDETERDADGSVTPQRGSADCFWIAPNVLDLTTELPMPAGQPDIRVDVVVEKDGTFSSNETLIVGE